MVVGCGIAVTDYENAVLDGVSSLNINKPKKAFEDFSRAIQLEPELSTVTWDAPTR